MISNTLTLFHTGICTTFKKMPCCERDQWQNWKITWTALENPEAASFHHSAGLPVRTYDACLPKCPGHPHPGRAGPETFPCLRTPLFTLGAMERQLKTDSCNILDQIYYTVPFMLVETEFHHETANSGKKESSCTDTSRILSVIRCELRCSKCLVFINSKNLNYSQLLPNPK